MKKFLEQKRIFTIGELNAFLSKGGANNPLTRESLLRYYRKKGRLLMVKRGLYLVVPFEGSPETVTFDQYLLASKMAEDAILSHHTALEFHGKAYSILSKIFFLTAKRVGQFSYRGFEFCSVSIPDSLVKKHEEGFAVIKRNISGTELYVTSLERTLVDVLHRPEFCGGWEEVWRSLESIEFIDVEQVIKYCVLLNNATTCAKVGFFLDQHRDALMLNENDLKPLKKLLPHSPHYMVNSKRKGGKYFKDWNIVVPEEIVNRKWEEVL